MKWIKRIAIAFLVLVIIYLAGPHPSTPVYNSQLPIVPSNAKQLENYISVEESAHHIKPNNEARIVWANDSLHQSTEYAIVYLHGFSASQEEGNPVHRNIAKMFGCNLYLSRLSQHGIDTTDALINLNADNYWESAKEAFAIGKQLGKKIILMGTSTGGTQALQLAAAYPNDVAALILLSPNIAINDPNAWLLNKPWGLQIARLVLQSKFRDIKNDNPDYPKYWNTHYRLESVVALQEMLATTMTKEIFEKVKQPVLLLYYYKDEQHQDKVVKVDAMKKMFEQLGTSNDKKKSVAIPTAENHVLGSPIVSHDIITPQKEIASFLSGVLQMPLK